MNYGALRTWTLGRSFSLSINKIEKNEEEDIFFEHAY